MRCSATFRATSLRKRASFSGCPSGDGAATARALWRETGVRVLPGAYLGRDDPATGNPGCGYIRVALVAGLDEISRGLGAIRAVLGAPHSTERV